MRGDGGLPLVARAAGALRRTGRGALVLVLVLVLVLGALLLAQGCVQTSTTTSGAPGVRPADSATQRPDLVTSSDEAPERRRARLRYELAANYFQNDQTNIALDEVKQSLTADPTFPDAYNLRGLIYMRLNDYALAEDSFQRAVSLNPRDANAMHNYGWMLCQQQKYPEATAQFRRAVAVPSYTDKAKTLMTEGLCEVRGGAVGEAERTLLESYALDPSNPITGFTLANLLRQRGELARAQFYIRRVNNGEFSTSESLWLGIKIERRLGDQTAVRQLADQLRKRYPLSAERASYDRGAFDE
ncbi:type IV pilus assembly protein PilF [Xylophilus ampelinus]|uniref:Type IV pilus assembly protein PilF n=2 Tax=Xylophilus ampelinus TaxID=54067 RepID=A0A318SLE6_9BURK|nr:type IV pilus assembly protein PilF [Xylophilus ampelinus]